MVLTYRKTEQANVVLNDLIKINNDRIECYQQAISKTTHLDLDLSQLFSSIIAEGHAFKQQLIDKIVALNGNPKDAITLSGVIHRAWLDLKVTFTGNTRNAILTFCEYNEDVAQHAYSVALDFSQKKNAEVYALIEQQQRALKSSREAIKKCREARNYLAANLVYFN